LPVVAQYIRAAGRQGLRGKDVVGIEASLGVLQPRKIVAVGRSDLFALVRSKQVCIATR
jgi:hypothetical protein